MHRCKKISFFHNYLQIERKKMMETDNFINNVGTSKEELITLIKEWVGVDAEMRNLQLQIRKLREKKHELTGDLVKVMKLHEIDCFDLKDGALIYKKNIVKKGISSKSLLQLLMSFFEQDDVLHVDPEKVKTMCSFVMNNREEKIKETVTKKKKIESS